MITTIDPASEEVIERFPYMDGVACDEKVQQAVTAFKQWRDFPIERRSAALKRVAELLRTESESLASTAVREMGKPIVQARAEVEKCAWTLEFFADNAAAMTATQDAPSNAARSYVAFRPLGVVLAIMPWNFPYWQVVRAAAPALMAGNTMLLKHADNTTKCALEIERIFAAAGTPNGVFGTLLMTNEDVDELIGDPRIAAVTLTGSERAGVAVASAAGLALKKCVLELGGSDAFVVLEDADLERAATSAVTARFQNNGQSCIAAKRFIVVDSVYDRFLSRFVELAQRQRVGNPADAATDIGPCARGDLLKTLHEQVSATLERGAELKLGGHPLECKGYYYQPTIVAGVKPGMRMFDEEVFGPAAAVIRAKDARAAIALANASNYGLGFSMWTHDVARADQLAAEVEAGAVFVNGLVASDPRLPFGGVKKSGYGRELSHFGIHEFANIQTVWFGKDGAQQAIPTE
ncbi:MAG TPA: NAD-dependent succinate-semialdehyde dehydrogenase [Candidatus Baltobacteraceae bacterium]|nr:NAD-dependent succinate-semialdehyde dehydrogenase [Candidatus Baltobacteraceae bacterium]